MSISSPRQVLLLTEETGVGGVQTTLHWLESGLAERGWHVTRLPVRQGRPSLWACWQAARRAQVLVASNNFLPAYVAVALGWLARRPSVVWVHGPLQEVLQQAGASCLKRWWLRMVYRGASQWVCASQTSRDSWMRAMTGADADGPEAMCVIRNPAVVPGAGLLADGVPASEVAAQPQLFSAKPPELVDRAVRAQLAERAESNGSAGFNASAVSAEPVSPLGSAFEVIPLGFVGRLSPEKQPLQLLPMLRLLPPACQLHVVGDGELMGAMRSAGQDLLAQGRLHLHGQQTLSAQTYRAWRATVLCSRYEGYPMTALESLACGVPCVSTPIPAMLEMLGVQAPDWLAHDESPAALAKAVQRCLAQTAADRHAAIDLLQQQHRLETFVQAWDQLLRRLLQRSGLGEEALESEALNAEASSAEALNHEALHDDPAAEGRP